MRLRTLIAIGAIAAVPAIALAQGMGGMDMPGMNMGAAPNTEANAAFAAANMRMMEDMNVALTGNPDRDFVLMMIPHHQGAIDMAQIELQYGTDPELRAIAEGIIAAQEAEIAQFNAWLAAHP